MQEEKLFKIFFWVSTVLSLAIMVAIAAVAVHFIGKYW